MYQYSLEYYIKIFKLRLEKAPNPEVLEQRLSILIEDMTLAFYTNICRGLFEKDKLLYSFLIAVNIKIDAKEINPREWNFFLRGPSSDIPLQEDQKIPDFVNEKIVKACISLSKESPTTFSTLPAALIDETESETWKKIIDSRT